MASAAKKTNTIVQIEHNGVTCTDQAAKAHAFFQFYVDLIGQGSSQSPNIYWENLYGNQHNHHDLQTLE